MRTNEQPNETEAMGPDPEAEPAEESEAPADTEAAQAEATETADGSGDSVSEETPAGSDAELEAAAADLDAALQARDEMRNQLLRARAEFDNYRKRVARDQDVNRRRALAGLLSEFLPIHDNLARALEHADSDPEGFREGVEMVAKQFESTMTKQGVTRIKTEGEPFDPELHEAMMQMPSEEIPEGHVAQELQSGFSLGEDMVLRHARVIVSTGAPAQEE